MSANNNHNRRRRPATTPVPIPATNPPSSELLTLISSKSWPAVIERCTSHPHEVGSSLCLRNERGYTALHCVVAYNRTVGEDLVGVVQAILRAAEEIDWGSEYSLSDDGDVAREGDVNTNEVRGDEESNGPRKTGGSWRLLMDQKNHAKWSPLHLVFVQGGVTFGKVALAKALLQMNNKTSDDNEEIQQHRQNLFQLVDRQQRTILHHNSETRVPTDDNFDAAHFILSVCPSLMFSKDDRNRTPLEYVLNRLTSDPTTKSLRLLVGRGRDEEEADKRIYRMLKLLIGGMEREEIRCKMAEQHDELADGGDHIDTGAENGTTNDIIADEPIYDEADAASCNVGEMALSGASYEVTEAASAVPGIKASNTTVQEISPSESGLAAAMRELAVNGHERRTVSNQTINHDNTTRRNVLHSACQLSRGSCPPDGSLVLFLASEKASQLEYGKESVMKLAEGKDEVGNHALHIFLSNKTYASPMGNGDGNDASRSNHSHQSVEYQIVKALIESHPSSISTPNDDNNLPLKLAMRSGLQNVIALLVVEYPEAVLMDPSMENMVFSEVLISISLSLRNRSSNNVNEEMAVDEEVSEESKMLSTMFYLIRSRPDVVALGGAAFSSVAPSVVKGKIDKSPTLFRRVMKKLWKK